MVNILIRSICRAIIDANFKKAQAQHNLSFFPIYANLKIISTAKPTFQTRYLLKKFGKNQQKILSLPQ